MVYLTQVLKANTSLTMSNNSLNLETLFNGTLATHTIVSSNDSSSLQSITFGVLSTIIGVVTIVLAYLQLIRTPRGSVFISTIIAIIIIIAMIVEINTLPLGVRTSCR